MLDQIQHRISGRALSAVTIFFAANPTVSIAADIELFKGGTVSAQAKASALYDDNIYLQDTAPISAWLTVFTPEISVAVESEKVSFSSSAVSRIGSYPGGERASFKDYLGSADFRWQPMSTLGLTASGRYSDANQRVNADESMQLNPVIEAERVISPEAEIGLVASTPSKRSQIKYSIGSESQDFFGEERDFDNDYTRLEISYRLTPRVILTAESSNSEITYKDVLDRDALDSEERGIFVGATYDLPKTKITARYGKSEKNFASATRETRSVPVWDVGLDWSFRTYSGFKLNFSKTVRESLGQAGFIESSSGALSWHHQWTSKFQSNFAYSQAKGEFSGIDRERALRISGVSLQYLFADTCFLGAGFTSTRSDDELNGFEDISVERNEIFLSISGPL
ncbi:outer membrane beta-barrel protein [Microbulbifer sp. SA54]|uniref:outer membrane beta-barrel protein n=1 Tax=Microbulbifer sp. SA54 TaxID=3401577 RepID=UPI003AB0DBC4